MLPARTVALLVGIMWELRKQVAHSRCFEHVHVDARGGHLIVIDPAPTITAMLNSTPSNPPIPSNPQPIEQVPVRRDAPYRPARS